LQRASREVSSTAGSCRTDAYLTADHTTAVRTKASPNKNGKIFFLVHRKVTLSFFWQTVREITSQKKTGLAKRCRKTAFFLQFPDVKKKKNIFIYPPNGNNTFVI
jgi:hypothetical protein